jgi:hypothetical protein
MYGACLAGPFGSHRRHLGIDIILPHCVLRMQIPAAYKKRKEKKTSSI